MIDYLFFGSQKQDQTQSLETVIIMLITLLYERIILDVDLSGL